MTTFRIITQCWKTFGMNYQHPHSSTCTMTYIQLKTSTIIFLSVIDHFYITKMSKQWQYDNKRSLIVGDKKKSISK